MSKDATTSTITCPPWCTEEHTDPRDHTHTATIGAFRQPALHTHRGRLLRPAGRLLTVDLLVSEDGSGRRAEERVTVHAGSTLLLELANGEARRLAALLTAAADRLDGIP